MGFVNIDTTDERGNMTIQESNNVTERHVNNKVRSTKCRLVQTYQQLHNKRQHF